jgi:uncharacterized membrane protein YjfL (UPF0719 family)
MREEMGDDEVFLLVISITLAAMTAYRWVVSFIVSIRFRARSWLLLLFTPVISLTFVLFVLRRWADDEVRDDGRYLTLLMLLATGWMGMFSALLGFFGLGLREDAAERRNFAAALAWCGAMLGVTILFAGGNIGEGPSLWNNVFSAGLGSATLLGYWLVLSWTANVSNAIPIDRDIASGIRMGAFLLADAIVFGRALAGTWQSAWHTADDFVRQAGITVAALGIAIIVEFIGHPTPKRPQPNWFSFGVLPAVCYVAAAMAWVKWLGPWK